MVRADLPLRRGKQVLTRHTYNTHYHSWLLFSYLDLYLPFFLHGLKSALFVRSTDLPAFVPTSFRVKSAKKDILISPASCVQSVLLLLMPQKIKVRGEGQICLSSFASIISSACFAPAKWFLVNTLMLQPST